MNPAFETLVQLEIDGLATDEQIRQLAEAETADSDLREARLQFRSMASALSGMHSPDPPPGLTDRVMAALPPPLPKLRPSSPIDRLAGLWRSILAPERRQLAYAFALGAAITFGLSAMLTQAPGSGGNPRTGTIIGSTSGTPGIRTIDLDDGAGRVEIQSIEAGVRVGVHSTHTGPIEVRIAFTDGAVALDAPAIPAGVASIQKTETGVTLSAPSGGPLIFQVLDSQSADIVVQIDGAAVLDRTLDLQNP